MSDAYMHAYYYAWMFTSGTACTYASALVCKIYVNLSECILQHIVGALRALLGAEGVFSTATRPCRSEQLSESEHTSISQLHKTMKFFPLHVLTSVPLRPGSCK
jgi:hypothetical protein